MKDTPDVGEPAEALTEKCRLLLRKCRTFCKTPFHRLRREWDAKLRLPIDKNRAGSSGRSTPNCQ